MSPSRAPVLVLGVSLAVASAAPALATQPVVQRLAVDVEGTGKPDTVVVYEGTVSVTVRVRFADPARAPQTFRFAVDPGREDAVCRLPVRLSAESTPRSGRGFALVDGACDAIHFEWDRRTRRVEWWRE
jgi:hypothetical protein